MLAMQRNIFVRKIHIAQDVMPAAPFSLNHSGKHSLGFYIMLVFALFVVLNAVAIGLLFFR